jgi:hypothetical protein
VRSRGKVHALLLLQRELAAMACRGVCAFLTALFTTSALTVQGTTMTWAVSRGTCLATVFQSSSFVLRSEGSAMTTVVLAQEQNMSDHSELSRSFVSLKIGLPTWYKKVPTW